MSTSQPLADRVSDLLENLGVPTTYRPSVGDQVRVKAGPDGSSSNPAFDKLGKVVSTDDEFEVAEVEIADSNGSQRMQVPYVNLESATPTEEA